MKPINKELKEEIKKDTSLWKEFQFSLGLINDYEEKLRKAKDSKNHEQIVMYQLLKEEAVRAANYYAHMLIQDLEDQIRVRNAKEKYEEVCRIAERRGI